MNINKVFKRSELKYLITLEQMQSLKNVLEIYMEKDKYFKSTIRNIYYDTPSYLLIRTSLEKPDYKEKLRIRSYKKVNDSDDVFIELKKKFKKIVYKRREVLSYNAAKQFLNQKVIPNDLQITNEIAYTINYYQTLKPTIFLAYDRLAYIGKEDKNLRITFDSNIIFRNYDIDLSKDVYGTKLLDDNLVLLEIKTLMGLPRWLLDFLGENKIYKQSFSKYGLVYRKSITKEEGRIYA